MIQEPANIPSMQDTVEAADHDTRAKRLDTIAKGGLAILLLVVLLGGFLVPIGGAVIAQAEVSPETQIKRIAHPTGGVIAEIMIADGAEVEKGDLLVRLESDVTEMSAALTNLSLTQLIARRASLLAEIENRTSITFPRELLADDSEQIRTVVSAEKRRWQVARSERSSIRTQLRERVNQIRRQIDGYTAQIAALEKQQELIEPELKTLRDAFEKGYVTIRQLNAMERRAFELEGAIGSLQANIAQSNAGIAQAEEQRIQVDQSARAQASTELAQIEAAINDQRVASANAGESFDRSTIRAPYAGTIDKLAFSAVGEVVRPAETILEIVPRDDRMVFEGLVLPADIDRVAVGQLARIRLSAFNQATTPELKGEVIFVSANPFSDDNSGIEYFRVRVALNPSEQAIADRLALVSGMPAELFIETQNRSMISFVTKPLVDQFQRAFRD